MTKDKSPLLAIVKEPSPSVNPINHSKKLELGNLLSGYKSKYSL
jgi:hypothetical protein